ncbi:hypothetical protein [Haloarcula marina]|uniref:hypothetical protein n=1 Tax=Haloarcula marina TaxID=2961574 RepID=UPI0020B6692D|nr:hypothetical protein [Halomicroarcula marina]
MDHERLGTLYDHLAATGERPVDRAASRWLGEAEAVAKDALTDGLDPSVRRERVAQIPHLLDNVEETGDEVADDHVAAAEAILDALLAEE